MIRMLQHGLIAGQDYTQGATTSVTYPRGQVDADVCSSKISFVSMNIT